ncbi:hypothetical protein COL516b_010624 [Colletotrichum fioriniae]|nr:uncharacterized protein COL516b_010624 [Colletotrichum fioriniae]KAJ0297575.1 hypothetical protein COL516b_010624 [Colletotrichum fioriniae]
MKPFPGIRRVPRTSARSYGTISDARGAGPEFLSKKSIREKEAKAAKRAPPLSRKEAKAQEIQDAPKRKAEERQAQFTRRIQEVLGHDGIAKDVRIDKENKKVRTSAGDLPISPVMDPGWMDVRTRYRMPKPRPKSKRPPSLSSSGEAPAKHKYKIRMGWDERTQSKSKFIVKNKLPNGGRFRVKLEQNPYVHALASPIRFCPVTGTSLPKYFLQNFKAVTNPDTKGHWFIPGDVEVSWTHKEAMEEELRQLDNLGNRSEELDDVENAPMKPEGDGSKELDGVKDEPGKPFKEEGELEKSDGAEDEFNKSVKETTGSTKPEEKIVEPKKQNENKPHNHNSDTAADDFEKHFENVLGSEKNGKKEKSHRVTAASNRTTPPKELPEDPLAKQKETDQLLIKSPSAYVVSRKPIIDSMAGKRGKTPFGDGWRMLLGRNQKVMNSDIPKRLVWREDMGDFVLENLRKNIMKYIDYYVETDEGHRLSIQPLETWEDVHDAEKRSCLLWYDDANITAGESRWDEWMKEGKVKPFATYDVPDAKYEKSLPIYDIGRLMGPKYLAKLRAIPMFREHSLFVVRRKRSIPLHLYLWKLQAYMAEYPSAEKIAEQSAEKRMLDKKRREEERQEERQEELVQEQYRLEEEAREEYIRAKAERARIIQERIEREMRGFDERKDMTPEVAAERGVRFEAGSTAISRGTAAAPMTSADLAAQLTATPRAASSPSAWSSAAIKPVPTIKGDRKAEVPQRPTPKTRAESTAKRSAKAPTAAPMTAADFTAQLMATPEVGSRSDSWASSAVKSVAPAKAINKAGLTSHPSTKVDGESTPQRAGTTAETTAKADVKGTSEPKAGATKPKVKPVKPRW